MEPVTVNGCSRIGNQLVYRYRSTFLSLYIFFENLTTNLFSQKSDIFHPYWRLRVIMDIQQTM